MNRAERRALGWRGPMDPNEPTPPAADDIAHAVCRSCTRYRVVFLPARICTKCLDAALAKAQAESAAMLLAALEADE